VAAWVRGTDALTTDGIMAEGSAVSTSPDQFLNISSRNCELLSFSAYRAT